MKALIILMILSITCLGVENVAFDQLLQKAYKNNSEVKIGLKNIQKMEAKLSQVNSYHYPSLTINSHFIKFLEPMHFDDLEADVTMNMPDGQGGQVAQTFKDAKMDFEMSGSWMLQNELELFWPIFAWFKVVNLGNAVKEAVKIEQYQLKLIKNKVLKELSIAYSQYILAVEALKVLNDTIKEMEALKKNTKREMEGGENSNITLKDIIQIDYDLKDMQVWLPKLENMRDLSLEAIKFLVNDKNLSINIKDKKVNVIAFNMNLPAIKEIAVSNRPEMRLLKGAIKAINYQKSSEFADYLPQIGIMGKAIHRLDDFDANQEWEFIGGIGLKWNIFNGMLTTSKIKEKKKEIEILKAKYDMLKRGVYFQVTKAFKVFKQNELQLTIRDSALLDAEKKLQEVKQGYQYQVTTVKDLNEAQVQKRWAEAHYLFKKLDYVKSLIELNYVTGKFLSKFH